jgi:hypothetical protein
VTLRAMLVTLDVTTTTKYQTMVVSKEYCLIQVPNCPVPRTEMSMSVPKCPGPSTEMSKSVPRCLGFVFQSLEYLRNKYSCNFLFCIEWFYKMYNAIDITTQDIIDCISVSEVLTWTSRYSVLDISVLTWTSQFSVLDSSGLG